MGWAAMVEQHASPGVAVSLIERSYPIRHAGRIVLGPAAEQAQARSFAAHTASEPAYNFVLDDVVLDPVTGIVFQADDAQRWACYGFGEHEVAPALARVAAARPLGRGRTFYCGFNRNWRNHGHWLAECLPAIAGYALHSERGDGVLLLPPLDADRWRMLALADADVANVETIDPEQAIACERLVVSSLLAARTAPSMFCAELFERMRERAEPSGEAGAAHALYVCRLDTAYRPMRNEAELVALMAARGIEVLQASRLSIDRQIAKFRAADLVIGAHGAGLANIVFCRPGSVVYELFPAHWVYPNHNMLAQQNELHYWADAFEAHGTFERCEHRVPWTVDLDVLSRRLDEIERALITAGR